MWTGLSSHGQNAHWTLGGIAILSWGNNDERTGLRKCRQPRRSLDYVVPVQSDLVGEHAIGAEADRGFDNEAACAARVHKKLPCIG